MLTIEPPPRAFIAASASCIRMNGARRLMAIIRSQNAVVALSIGARDVEAGVVDQDVEAAEAIDGALDERQAHGFLGEVALEEGGVAAARADRLDQARAGLRVAAVHDDAGRRGRRSARRCPCRCPTWIR